MDRVWPIISNTESLAVNHAWAGHPGTLAKVYPTIGLSPLVENWCQPAEDGCLVGLHASPSKCDGTPKTIGWQLKALSTTDVNSSGGTMLIAPNPTKQPRQQCLAAHHGDGAYGTDCPPPTSTSGPVGCGLLILNCSRVLSMGSFLGTLCRLRGLRGLKRF